MAAPMERSLQAWSACTSAQTLHAPASPCRPKLDSCLCDLLQQRWKFVWHAALRHLASPVMRRVGRSRSCRRREYPTATRSAVLSLPDTVDTKHQHDGGHVRGGGLAGQALLATCCVAATERGGLSIPTLVCSEWVRQSTTMHDTSGLEQIFRYQTHNDR